MQYDNEFEPEIDFKKVLKTPRRWFGFIYIFILILIIIGGHFYLVNLQNMELNRSKSVQIISHQVEDVKMMKGSVQEGINVNEIVVPNDSILIKGKELFMSSCASCHGNEGKGDGVAGAALQPKPRNFLSKEGWKNGMKISQMFKTLEEGIPGSGMTSYEFMPNYDKFALIHFIRSLRNDFPLDTKEDLDNLDLEYNISQGKQTSNQMPVSLAMSRLIEENKARQDLTRSLIDKINGSIEPGAILFKENVYNNSLCLYYLNQNSVWKSNLNQFIKYISQSIGDNGFKVSMMRMPKPQWQTMFDFLKKVYS